MNLMEEWSFGRLLKYLRGRTNQKAEDIVKVLGYAATSWLSDYESDRAMRPPIERVERFGEVYPMYPNVYTYLLRASDYPPTDAEFTGEWQGRLNHLVDESLDPMYALNYRYQLMAWNRSFATIYDGAILGGEETLRLPIVPRGGGVITRRGEEQNASTGLPSPSGTWESKRLSLSVGMPFLLLVFSPYSRLRKDMELEQWEKFSHYFLVRFWRTTLPLIQPNWYPKRLGEPDWLHELLEELTSLPNSFGDDFFRESTAIRQRVEEDPDHPSVQLFGDFINDSVVFWHGGTKYRLEMSELRDGRFMLFRQSPLSGGYAARSFGG